MPAPALACQITLSQSGMARAQNLDRQVSDQKLSFDFARGNVVRAAHASHSNVSRVERQELIRAKSQRRFKNREDGWLAADV